MQDTPHTSPFCGYISNAQPLSYECMKSVTSIFTYRNGKLYLCDYHAGSLGALIARKEEELRDCPFTFQTVAYVLIQQLQYMIEIWTSERHI